MNKQIKIRWSKILLLLLPLLSTTFIAKAERTPLPPEKELAAIHDSIIHEALLLYKYEKCAWHSGDAFFKECERVEDVDAILTYALPSSALTTIFFNQDSCKCYYQYIVSENDSVTVIKEPRDVTEYENKLYAYILRCRNQITQLNVFPPESYLGKLNMEVLPLSENLVRFYFIQGANRSNVIPFGNDFCFDFDSEGNMISWRKFHSGLLADNWTKNMKPDYLTHSHLTMTPYMATTDICTFLLYGRDIYKMKKFSVCSSVFGYFFEFDADKLTIKTMNVKQMIKSQKRRIKKVN